MYILILQGFKGNLGFLYYMDVSEINDIRMPPQFKGVSFSNYKKTDVKNEFVTSMLNGKVEQACNWAAELVCAGHYLELWENILYYCAKHIHVGNPKLVCYLEKRYSVFKTIINQGNFITPLDLRNNKTIRNLFAEVVSVLCLSAKKHSFEVIKINREEEFDMTQMTERLKAPNVDFIKPVFTDEDPKEIYIPMNEFAYNISKTKKNTVFACYWIEWILEFEAICKKRKTVCACAHRPFVTVEPKVSHDLVWIIWDALFYYVKQLENPFLEKTMSSLLSLFSLHYTNACCKKRRYMLYFAVSLCTEHADLTVELVANKKMVELAVNNINNIYRQIKKNEVSPGTDYLFNGLNKQSELEKSLEKLNMVNSITFGQNEFS
jgi:hypothetical protein